VPILQLSYAPRLTKGCSPLQIEGHSDERASFPWAHLRIPPFPQVAIQMLRLTSNEDVSMRHLSGLISSEPAFSSEVLTIANSALYPTRVPITSVLQAIVVLGTNALRGLCITVGIRTYLGAALNHESLRAIWRHNMACALIARQLALAGSMNGDTAYTAGIMHDIGRLALAVISPKRYAALLEKHSGTPSSILQLEHELFGFDHCLAGRHLVVDWKLPSDFEPIVAEHHSPRSAGDPWTMSALINFSCRLADTAGFAVFQGCELTPYADLLNEMPDQERKTFGAGIEQLSFEISRQINAVESP
jgi:HD-like signal output (HDOD) protein